MSPSERAARLADTAAVAALRPRCRYDLGASHEAACPECGARYTIAALIAQQPADAPTEVERLLR